MARLGSGGVRYAVVGLGHTAQVAMLPAFAHARRNSRLTALVSDDRAKLKPSGAVRRQDPVAEWRRLRTLREGAFAAHARADVHEPKGR